MIYINSLFEGDNALVLGEVEGLDEGGGVAFLLYFVAKLLKLILGKSFHIHSIHI